MRCFEHNIGLIIAKKMQENCATNYGLDCTVCARFQSRRGRKLLLSSSKGLKALS